MATESGVRLPDPTRPVPQDTLLNTLWSSNVASGLYTIVGLSTIDAVATASTTSVPVPSQGPSVVNTTTHPLAQTAADSTGDSPSTQSIPRARVYAIVGGLGAVCALLVLALAVVVLAWRKKRWPMRRWSRVVHDDVQGGQEPTDREEIATSLPASESVRTRTSTLVGDTEKGALGQHLEGPYRDGAIESSPPDSAAHLPNDRTTLGNDRELADTSHPRSVRTPRIPRAPPPAYWTRRRRSTDGGVRLAGRGFSLRRVGTASSSGSGAASEDSLTTLPPAYQARY
ncbi:hypothetical protein EIP86_006076 [Pleurotus ostreatoroseus]|nr:hypothetical protein EIP86_006076 [Pleurotus ostreatoroseus]